MLTKVEILYRAKLKTQDLCKACLDLEAKMAMEDVRTLDQMMKEIWEEENET